MNTPNRFCEQCGSPLRAGVRFCERCGAPVELERAPAAAEAEAVIGHLPAERLEEGKGFLGRPKTTQLNFVITTSRILCLRETEETNDAWLGETERLDDEEKRSGVPWRTLIDHYVWRSPVWAAFYETPPDELLASDRGNGSIPLSEIVRATVTLDDEMDRLELAFAGGQVFRYRLYNLTGRPAARFLAQALGPERVRLVAQPAV
jgi:hypothetical protein